jgi:hypothetical protein
MLLPKPLSIKKSQPWGLTVMHFDQLLRSASSLFRKSTRLILPDVVLGSSSKNSIFLGYLYGAVNSFTCD